MRYPSLGRPWRMPRYGFGATAGQTALAAGSSAASSGVSIAVATGAIAGPVGAAIGAGIALASLAIQAIMNSGCGQSCIVSTGFANQANSALQQNIEAYFAIPAPRPRSAQTAALQNFDQFWAWLQAPQQCGNPALGTAGQKCISDRAAGACTWKQAADTVPPWGVPAAGACWNWFNGYRDPIANDTNVYDDSATAAAGSVLSSVGSSVGSLSWLPLALAGGLVILLVVNS